MREILLPSASALLGVCLGIYGALLAWRQDLFLRFHDTFVNRSSVNRHASWRHDIHRPQYRTVGILFALLAVFIVVKNAMLLVAHLR